MPRPDAGHSTHDSDGADRLPALAVLPCLDKLDAAVGTPPAQLVQAALPFIARLNIGVGPADCGFKLLLAQQANRLKRARRTAGVQQQRLHQHLLSHNDFLIPIPEKSSQKKTTLRKSAHQRTCPRRRQCDGRAEWFARNTNRPHSPTNANRPPGSTAADSPRAQTLG